MITNETAAVRGIFPKRNKLSLPTRIWKYRSLFLMILPGLFLLLLFNYGSMYGLIIAFKDYRIGSGIWGSKWVGLKYFSDLFASRDALSALKNTILISLYRLFWGFPAPILLALLLNEIGHKFFKRVVQTINYLPHFISWIIISGMVINMLSPNTGIVNYFIQAFGGKPIYFMTDPHLFRSILITTGIWKEVGWGSVLFLAALSNVDAEQYEAAIVDGATRFQRARYISIPAMIPIISICLILSMGSILNAGFDQIFNMYNTMVYSVTDIIDTYVYRVGMVDMSYSFSTAVGLFKSVAGLILMLIVNTVTRNIGDKDAGIF